MKLIFIYLNLLNHLKTVQTWLKPSKKKLNFYIQPKYKILTTPFINYNSLTENKNVGIQFPYNFT